MYSFIVCCPYFPQYASLSFQLKTNKMPGMHYLKNALFF